MFNIIGRIQDKCEQKKGYADGIILGREKGKTIIDNTKGSLLAIADERSGVIANSIIPTLLNWQGNVIIIDFKEECYYLTAGYRKSLGQEVIKISEENINDLKIQELLLKDKFSLYICISSFITKDFIEKIKLFITEILQNRSEIKKEMLFILPCFNIFGGMQILKDNVYLDNGIQDKLKFLLISDVKNLLENGYKIALLFGHIKKVLLYPAERENCKDIKFLQYLIEEMKPKKEELLYFNKIKNRSLKKIEYYKEHYFIEKIRL